MEKYLDCPLHHDVRLDLASIRDDMRKINQHLSGLKCSEYQVRLSKLEEDISMLKREVNEINKERYTARGIVILLAAIGSMIGSLIMSYVK